MDIHLLWISEHDYDMYTLCIHDVGTDFVPAVEHIPAKEFADHQNAAIITHILWICCLDKLVFTDKFSWNISNSKDYDHTVYYIYTKLLLFQEILHQSEINAGMHFC